MKRSTILILSITVVAVLGFLLAGIWLSKQKGARTYVWGTHYQVRGRLKKQPYGLHYFRMLMEDRGRNGSLVILNKPLKPFFAENQMRKGTYMLIGEEAYYTEEGVEALLAFIRRGNNAFLAVNRMPDMLLDKLEWYDAATDSVYPGIYYDTVSITMPSLDPGHNYSFWFQRGSGTSGFNWTALQHERFNNPEHPFSKLGFMKEDSLCCFGVIPVGNGFLYLHSSPLVFTNYHIVTRQGFRYASRVFGFLDPEQPVYFDTFSSGSFQGEVPEQLPQSWLQFIIASPGLREAWYLLVFIALLFVVFRSRRRQRAVPVLEPNLNNTLEYVSTISRIYLAEKKHKRMAEKQKHLFYQHLGYHFGIRVINNPDALAKEISVKTGLSHPLALDILGTFAEMDMKEEISAQELFSLHEKLHQYYSKRS